MDMYLHSLYVYIYIFFFFPVTSKWLNSEGTRILGSPSHITLVTVLATLPYSTVADIYVGLACNGCFMAL